MKTRSLTFAITSIFIAAIMFVFASCMETVDESVVSQPVNETVTEESVENAEAAVSQDAAASEAAAEEVAAPEAETDGAVSEQPVVTE